MRVRLRLDALQHLMARSPISQNHWAIRLGLSKGHLSNLLAGKHLYPSGRTRERMLEVLGVAFEELFEVEPGHDLPEHAIQAALRDRYLIDRTLGQGGMGTVFLARDLRLARPVAIKIVNDEVVSGVGPAELLKEVINTSRLQHPNIPMLLDAGEVEGSPYYVLPYVRGGSLRETLQERNRLPVGEALTIAAGVAGALDHAHGLGILHCDVKPGNILLAEEHAWLIDFGIARVVQAEVFAGEGRPEFDSGAGTPAYVSPEQARGDADLDGRSDIYSLAGVLYEMLSGKPPFEGDTTLATVAKRFMEPPPDLTVSAPWLPRELATVVQRGMSVDRGSRPATATQFIADCRAAVANAGSIVGIPLQVRQPAPRATIRTTMANLAQETRFAIRSIARTPGLALAIALTLGLGIGVNAVMFQVLDRLFVRGPAHVQDPGSVRRVLMERTFLGRLRINTSLVYPLLDDMRQSDGFTGAAAWFETGMTLGRGLEAREVTAQLATHDFFPLLGVSPAVGRFFDEADDAVGVGGTVVLGWDYWQREFGGDRAVVGRSVELESQRFTVVGVAPRGFNGLDTREVDLYLPLRNTASMRIGGPWETSRGIQWLRIVARVKPGVSAAAAEERATALLRAGQVGQVGADPEARIVAAPVLAARGPNASSEGRVSLWAGGVAVVLLLITASNVVNLMLARLTYRQGEFAIRAALGASRPRLMTAILGEVMVLALLAGAAGLVIAQFASAVLARLIMPGAAWTSPMADLRVVGFTLGCALLLGLVAGIIPAWQAGRADAGALLRTGRAGSGPGRSAIRTGLLMLQAALSVALLVSAGLFVDSFRRVRAIDAGLAIDNLLVTSVDLDPAQFPQERALALQHQGIERLQAMRGVYGVTGSNSMPMQTSWAETLRIPGVDSLPSHASGGPYINVVGDNYFDVIGTAIRSGRGFTAADRVGTPRVAVVGEAMARLIWGNDSPIGRCLMIGDDSVPPCTEVVGTAADAPRSSLLQRDVMQYYVPSAQFSPETPHVALFVRSGGDPEQLREAVRGTIQGLSPDLSYVRTETMWQVASSEVRTWTLGSTLFSLFGLMALVVASIGLYSVVSFDVARRTREIGIRIALGATAREVIMLVFRTGAVPVGIGLLAGLALSAVATRWLAPLLFETDPHDPVVYAIVTAVLLVAGLLACLLPALRAVRVSPVEALRTD